MEQISIYLTQFSIVIMIIAALVAYYYKDAPGARAYFIMMLAAIILGIGVLLEVSSDDIFEKVFWRNVQQIALILYPVFSIMIVFEVMGKEKQIRSLPVMLIAACCIAALILVWTDGFHHLMREKIIIANGELEIRRTLLANTVFLFGDICTVFSWILFINYARKINSIHRNQAVIILTALVIPFIPNLIEDYASSFLKYNFSYVIGFAITGLILFLGIFRYNLFLINPIARETILNSIREGYLVLDISEKVIDFNDETIKLMKSMKLNINEIQDGDLITLKWNEWHNACRNLLEKKFDIELKLDTSVKYYSIHVYPIYREHHRAIGTVSIFYDITEKKEVERKLKLETEKLAEINAVKDKLISIIAHDIRNPVAILLNLVELIEADDEVLRGENGEIINEIIGLVKNMFPMVENLLDWVETQKRGIVYNPHNYNLSSIIEEAVRLVKPNADIKNIKIIVNIPPVKVYVDREMIEIVIRNLITNSVKFVRNEGHIDISVHTSEKEAVISVLDDGIGINKTVIDDIIANNNILSLEGTNGEKGSGLGLFLCKEFVQKNGGHFWIESTIDEGSNVSFSVPLEKKWSDTVESNSYR